MNKSELSAAVATKTGLTQAQAEAAVNGVIDAVTDTLKSGGDVRLVGFGTFSVSERAATTGRNPRTGETINIAASKQAKFKAGQALKSAVNGGWPRPDRFKTRCSNRPRGGFFVPGICAAVSVSP